MILWGPPGTGKTTLARLVAQTCDAEFIAFSAVMAGVKDIRAAAERAQKCASESGRRTVLFLDEVHRFNKAQQDAFLPWVEDGTLVFIGATTENPSFELNNALLSRARVYVLRALTEEDLRTVLDRALENSTARSGADRGGRGGPDADRTRGGWRCATRAQHARTRDRSRGDAEPPRHHRSDRGRSCSRRTATLRQAGRSVLRPDLGACTSPCAAAIRMQRSIGSAACSMAAAIRATSRAASCAWRPRTSAMPIRAV